MGRMGLDFGPIGVDLSTDVVDLVDSDEDVDHKNEERLVHSEEDQAVLVPDALQLFHNNSSKKQKHSLQVRPTMKSKRINAATTLKQQKIADTEAASAHSEKASTTGSEHKRTPQQSNFESKTIAGSAKTTRNFSNKLTTLHETNGNNQEKKDPIINVKQSQGRKKDPPELRNGIMKKVPETNTTITEKSKSQSASKKLFMDNNNSTSQFTTENSREIQDYSTMKETLRKRKGAMEARLERAKRVREMAEQNMNTYYRKQKEFDDARGRPPQPPELSYEDDYEEQQFPDLVDFDNLDDFYEPERNFEHPGSMFFGRPFYNDDPYMRNMHPHRHPPKIYGNIVWTREEEEKKKLTASTESKSVSDSNINSSSSQDPPGNAIPIRRGVAATSQRQFNGDEKPQDRDGIQRANSNYEVRAGHPFQRGPRLRPDDRDIHHSFSHNDHRPHPNSRVPHWNGPWGARNLTHRIHQPGDMHVRPGRWEGFRNEYHAHQNHPPREFRNRFRLQPGPGNEHQQRMYTPERMQKNIAAEETNGSSSKRMEVKHVSEEENVCRDRGQGITHPTDSRQRGLIKQRNRIPNERDSFSKQSKEAQTSENQKGTNRADRNSNVKAAAKKTKRATNTTNSQLGTKKKTSLVAVDRSKSKGPVGTRKTSGTKTNGQTNKKIAPCETQANSLKDVNFISSISNDDLAGDFFVIEDAVGIEISCDVIDLSESPVKIRPPLEMPYHLEDRNRPLRKGKKSASKVNKCSKCSKPKNICACGIQAPSKEDNSVKKEESVTGAEERHHRDAIRNINTEFPDDSCAGEINRSVARDTSFFRQESDSTHDQDEEEENISGVRFDLAKKLRAAKKMKAMVNQARAVSLKREDESIEKRDARNTKLSDVNGMQTRQNSRYASGAHNTSVLESGEPKTRFNGEKWNVLKKEAPLTNPQTSQSMKIRESILKRKREVEARAAEMKHKRCMAAETSGRNQDDPVEISQTMREEESFNTAEKKLENSDSLVGRKGKVSSDNKDVLKKGTTSTSDDESKDPNHLHYLTQGSPRKRIKIEDAINESETSEERENARLYSERGDKIKKMKDRVAQARRLSRRKTQWKNSEEGSSSTTATAKTYPKNNSYRSYFESVHRNSFETKHTKIEDPDDGDHLRIPDMDFATSNERLSFCNNCTRTRGVRNQTHLCDLVGTGEGDQNLKPRYNKEMSDEEHTESQHNCASKMSADGNVGSDNESGMDDPQQDKRFDNEMSTKSNASERMFILIDDDSDWEEQIETSPTDFRDKEQFENASRTPYDTANSQNINETEPFQSQDGKVPDAPPQKPRTFRPRKLKSILRANKRAKSQKNRVEQKTVSKQPENMTCSQKTRNTDQGHGNKHRVGNHEEQFVNTKTTRMYQVSETKEMKVSETKKLKQGKILKDDKLPKDSKVNHYPIDMNYESAAELQERLLGEAAKKVRVQAYVEIVSGVGDYKETTPIIMNPLTDVAEKFPNHWMWKDPYSCLGLPGNSSDKLVKSQYRRLARLYHPDKAKDRHDPEKFHGITKAYRKLLNMR